MDKLQLFLPVNDWEFLITASISSDNTVHILCDKTCPRDCDNDCETCTNSIVYEHACQEILDQYDVRVYNVLKYAKEHLQL
jgi:hypothetical protein